MTPDANDLCVFAVKRGYIESKEIYCNPLYPTYLSLVEKYQHSPYANGILNNHVAVNPKTDCSLLSDSSEVSFVPMANVQEKTNVVSYDMVAYETVKKGFTVFQRGDLIWAKITPCMQNGKSCIVDKMPTEIGFGSTEFHVIRKRNEKVAMSFFANHGYDTEGFTINPYMVVNKVFSSYYKHVQFPIVTFDELKREIQL